MTQYDVIVAGGGLAGLSAAIFLARAQVTVAIFDQGESSLLRVSRLNNYLGFPDGVSGSELIELGRRQAQRFGARLHVERLTAVSRRANSFAVSSSAGEYECTYLILASNKRTDLARALGLALGGFGGRFLSVAGDGATAVPNCYAAGRITGLPSQAIVSAGDGAKVAVAIIERLRGGYYVDHDV